MGEAINPLDLSFYPNLGAGALWMGLPLVGAPPVTLDTAPIDDPRRTWLWSPNQLFSVEATPDNMLALAAAGWEPLPERTLDALGMNIYHVWTQLRELRGVYTSTVQRSADGATGATWERALWLRSDDLQAVKRYPVALGFTLAPYPIDAGARAELDAQHAQGEMYQAKASETLPPPTLGTRGLVWTQREQEQDEGWRAYDLDELPPETRGLQARLGDALRELAAPHSWYAVDSAMRALILRFTSPDAYEGQREDIGIAEERLEQMRRAYNKYPADIWLERWREVQQMAQDLAAAYWEHHQRQLQPVAPARQLPMAPSVFRNNYAMIATPINGLHFVEGLSSANWQAREGTGAPYWRRETKKGREQGENTSTEMELRPEDMPEPSLATQEQIDQLWKMTRARSDLDGDLFLAMWAQHISAPKDAEGYASFTSDLFLDYRGITPITEATTAGDGRWRAGHRIEDKQAISAALWRAMAVWVKVRTMLLESGDQDTSKARKGRKRARYPFTYESHLWIVPDVIRQHELTGVAPDGASSHIVAWRFKPGPWAGPFQAAPNRHFAQLCQTALQYDPYREQWEKRLARYFVFHLRISGGPNYGGTSITRTIGDLLTELELPQDSVNPQRTRQRFERALARLSADGVIDTWNYASDNPELPRRNWLPVWELCKVRVTAAPLPSRDLLEGASDQTSDQGDQTSAQGPADA